MKTFSGFPEGKVPVVTLPEALFSQVIPLIDDLNELKVTLLVLWSLSALQTSGAPWITLTELQGAPEIRNALNNTGEINWEHTLHQALDRAVARGTLLTTSCLLADQSTEIRYFANSPRGRASVAAIQRGEELEQFKELERPNIFGLYEQNIGPLTALISEDLAEAEETFPGEWIEDAFHEAVKANVRNWKYVYAILKRWQEEGKDEVDRRDRETDPKKYIEGKYGHLIQH